MTFETTRGQAEECLSMRYGGGISFVWDDEVVPGRKANGLDS